MTFGARPSLTSLTLAWLSSPSKKLAGHADASMTARYDLRDEGAKRRAVQVLAIPGLAG